jgi:protein-export membrane protein SecD/preprotein translocase SecF subunit
VNLRKLRVSLLTVALVALVGVVGNVIAGNSPRLGLDLQGGASVTLEPVGEYDALALDTAVDLIRQRVDSLGVAEPEIVRQGDAIVVSLPGVSDPDEALATVSATGKVLLRPVLQLLGTAEPTPDTSPGTSPDTVPTDSAPDTAPDTVPADSVPADSLPDDSAPATTAAPGPARAAAPDTAAPDTAAPPDTDVPVEDISGELPVDADPRDGSQQAIVPDRDGNLYLLGPAGAEGDVLDTGASATIIDADWTVVVGLRPSGQAAWNAMAADCYNRTPTCPTGQLAIQLDDEVISAPVVQEPSFGREITISGQFSKSEAENLAKILEFGALPVQLEAQTVQVVSATLGSDSLRAAIIAGLIGIVAILLLLFFYYRLLALVVVGGLTIFVALTWSIIALLGATSGLALTLSGAAGLIVSIGITVDSYVVYFERLKDEMRSGRSFKASSQRAFQGAWRAIVVADTVSFIGALILWYLTVGSVRGFAFFLGLAALIDMLVAYVYTRPAVILLSRSRVFEKRKVLAVEVGEAMSPEGVAATRRGLLQRLYHGETTFDFYGKRRRGFVVSALFVVVAVVSLFAQNLNLGIDFEGGVAWEVPSQELTIDEARGVLDDNGIPSQTAKIQTLQSSDGVRLRIQVADQTEEVREAVRDDLAEAAGVESDEVSVASVSSSWGRSITEKAVRALIVFFVIVSLFIAWRFEWKMALAAFIAMLHDIAITVGIYSLLGLEVTPATVVAFLTILGYSLYDTIVVFDKVRENADTFKTHRLPYADVINVSMNQVLMRSLNTSISSVLPVLSLLIVGSWTLGARALEEFAMALLVGMLTGAYSSIYVASPLLGMMKEREPRYRSLRGQHATGEAMHVLSVAGPAAIKKELVRRPTVAAADGTVRNLTATDVLTHPPRPRKKRRR